MVECWLCKFIPVAVFTFGTQASHTLRREEKSLGIDVELYAHTL